MFVIGLTGGMAAGKSTVADYLKNRVIEILDADEIAKELVAPGTEIYSKLVEAFGKEILGTDGVIDRAKLGRIVFADQAKVELLNNITHPPICEKIRQILADRAGRLRSDDVVILRAPLLIEAGLLGLVDKVILVTAPLNMRIERIRKGRGLSENECRQRLRAQLSDEERLKVADYCVANDGSIDGLKKKVDVLWNKMKEDGVWQKQSCSI